MKTLYDIHTHICPQVSGTAIVQLPEEDHRICSNQWYSVGVHPWDICEDWRLRMAKVAVVAMRSQVVAIGETGLDKKNSPATMDVQLEVFREHVRLSELLRKPLLVHCVKAIDEMLAIRKEMNVSHPWVLHGYRGGSVQAEQLRKAGVLVSFGAQYNVDALLDTPNEYLLIESDTHDDVGLVYQRISEDLGVGEQTLRRTVAHNILQIFHSYQVFPF